MNMTPTDACRLLNEALREVHGPETDLHLEATPSDVIFHEADGVAFRMRLPTAVAFGKLVKIDRNATCEALYSMFALAGLQWGEGHKAGLEAGRRQMVNTVHELLGIDRIAQAIRSVGDER